MQATERFRVMIAEDNDDVVRSIVGFLSEKEDVEIVAVESDGLSAVNAALMTRPDVLVLDLVLPNWDGFAVMRRLSDHGLTGTRIIVLSSMSSDFMIMRALQHGAYYYMVKPFQPELLYGHIVQREPDLSQPELPAPERIDEEMALEQVLTDVLGLSPRHKGTNYLKSAVLTAQDLASMGGRITKEIYPAVARLYHASPVQVERAIRHAIDHAWNRGPMRESGLFRGVRRPSNGEVIIALAARSLAKR